MATKPRFARYIRSVMGRSPEVTFRSVLAVALSLGCVSGCQTLPFRSAPRPGLALLGFGAPVPYIGAEPEPGPPARGAGRGLADPAVDVYAATRPGRFGRAVRGIPERVYVPSSASGGGVEVIDARTFRLVGRVRTAAGRAAGDRAARDRAAGSHAEGGARQVVPSWDLRTLWAVDEAAGTLTPISPRTGRAGRPVTVAAARSLFFTPNGRLALVLAGSRTIDLRRVDPGNPRTLPAARRLALPCHPLGEPEFTAGGGALVAACGSRLLLIDPRRGRVTAIIRLPRRSAPRQVRISPDGRLFYVADAARGGLWLVDADRFVTTGFVPTGAGAHGMLPSRDGTALYVANRRGGSVSVVAHATRRVVRTWRLPGRAAPDIGGVSADGAVLWLADRRARAVLAVSTRTGGLLRRVEVRGAPGGATVFPQPGRYSLGHTGIYR